MKMISFKRMLLMIYLVVCLLFKVIKTTGNGKKTNNVKKCIEQIEGNLGKIGANDIKSYITNIILYKIENDADSYFGKNYFTEIKASIKPASTMKLPGKYCGETLNETKLIKLCEQEVIQSYQYLYAEDPDTVLKDALIERNVKKIKLEHLGKYIRHVSEHFVIDVKLLSVDKYCEREMEEQIQECIYDINREIGGLKTADDQNRILWEKSKALLRTFNSKFYFSEVRDNLVPSPEMTMPDKFCEDTYSTEMTACSKELVDAEFVGESTYDMINHAFYEIVGNNYKEKQFVRLYIQYIGLHLSINKNLEDSDKFCRSLILLQLDVPTEKVDFVLKRSEVHHNYIEDEEDEVSENNE